MFGLNLVTAVAISWKPNAKIVEKAMQILVEKVTQMKTLVHFYSAPQCNASSALATAIPSVYPSVRRSVRLSVCHTPVLCQNDGT